ncbi:MAG: SDR family NAD(P)-dependent oxidoreductase [Vulcanimicrobiaceae bacterium]
MRTALVTGGTRGIGKAIADEFRAAGFHVLAPARAELELSDSVAVEAYAKQLPDIDVLINNAGENNPLPLDQIALDNLERIIAVNVTAPFLISRHVATKMAQRKWGRVVNISSVYSLVSRAKRSMYSTTKAAVNGMTRALAVELGPSNVLVNSICPGFVDTDLTRQNNTQSEIDALCATVPLRRLASVEEIARLAFFLGSEANTYITGQSIVIDGGFLCQ